MGIVMSTIGFTLYIFGIILSIDLPVEWHVCNIEQYLNMKRIKRKLDSNNNKNNNNPFL